VAATAAVESLSVVETRKGSDPGSQPQGGPRDASLKIVIVDESPVRAAILEDGLREAGFVQVQRIEETRNLLSRIYALDPDVILIDLENPSRDELEQMFQMSRVVKRPIAMFVDQSDTASIQAISSVTCRKTASRPSSISASRALTPSRACKANSTKPKARSRNARSSTAPRAF
jgi:chemotaxis response regulator CheB